MVVGAGESENQRSFEPFFGFETNLKQNKAQSTHAESTTRELISPQKNLFGSCFKTLAVNIVSNCFLFFNNLPTQLLCNIYL